MVTARRHRRGRWWLVVLPVVLAALFGGGAYAVNRVTPPSYTADALVAVLPTDPAGTVSLPIAGIWVQVGNSDAVLRSVAGTLGVDEQRLVSSLSLTGATDAPVISISVTTHNAAQSAQWANAVAAGLRLEALRSPVPGYGLRQVATAVPPLTHSAPVSPLLIAAAAVLGAVLGLVAAQGIVRRRRRRGGLPG